MQGLSKAKSLERLSSVLKLFHIPMNLWFDVKSWNANSDDIIECVLKTFKGDERKPGSELLAIRSSACDEDGANNAKAGEYLSVLNVPYNDTIAIRSAIESVIASYKKRGTEKEQDEVIVQEMVLNPIMSGVVFTHDMNSGAPYYVINYDDESGFTNTVTSGEGEYANRTIYIHRDSINSLRSERFQKLLLAITELETVMESKFLDIEFAIGKDLSLYLLQIRSITTHPNWNRAVAKRIDTALSGIQSFVKHRLQEQKGVFGETTVLGQMPDWNPAEMIGRAPRALAFSLYRTLITDTAWRLARKRMGYNVPEGHPLMISLAGQPFIDTRLSFNSYLPAGLDSSICQKLVNAWVKRLKENPQFHDKIEFDVAITTFSFDIDEKIENQTGGLLSANEKVIYRKALHKQVLTLISERSLGSIPAAIADIEKLKTKQIQQQFLSVGGFGTLFSIIEDCVQYGTIPFSILARHGFIARTILLSLVKRGIFSNEEMHQLQSGIRTVASELVNDMRLMQSGQISRNKFMEVYGHLRPGTYDINSLRYDQILDLGDWNMDVRTVQNTKEYFLTNKQRNQINTLLNAEGFSEVTADELLVYFKQAIAGREYGKFVFTKSVSNILELIALFGEINGLSRDELSYIPINDILDTLLTSSQGSIEDRLRATVQYEMEKHAITAAIRLPQVLFDEAGVHVVPFQVSQPNFITNKNITGECILLLPDHHGVNLTGKIVLIENADPGFDWIFSQQIGGLITKYGGANSHMAIRCAEFGIPAAIGCGEQRFEILTKVERVMLDCSTSLIQYLY